ALPYTSTLWITFCQEGGSRNAAQLFVRLAPEGLRFGLRLGRAARAARARLPAGADRHAETIFRLPGDSGAPAACRFGLADLTATHVPLDGPDALRAWARGRSAEASCALAADDPLLAGDELVGRIALTFDRLLPLYACCVEDDPAGAL